MLDDGGVKRGMGRLIDVQHECADGCRLVKHCLSLVGMYVSSLSFLVEPSANHCRYAREKVKISWTDQR